MTSNTKYPVLFRTYARKGGDDQPRETELEAKTRAFSGLTRLANFTPEVEEELWNLFLDDKLFPSGRMFWVGGTPFSEKQENFYSMYNCVSLHTTGWEDFSDNFRLLMMGSGVGAVLEYENVDLLPVIQNKLSLMIEGEFGESSSDPQTYISSRPIDTGVEVRIDVGDSREGWVSAYLSVLRLSSAESLGGSVDVLLNVSAIRKAGEPIKGFGGVTNPTGLIPMFKSTIKVLNNALGRKLRPIECSTLLNHTAACTVAGNVRRSARIDQFSKDDQESALAKVNLWSQDEEGNWRVDPEKDVLRMANFTRVWHTKPTLEEITDSLNLQFKSGEGAIQYAPEAVARCNVDLLDTEEKRNTFISKYVSNRNEAKEYLSELGGGDEKELTHRIQRYGGNPCLEIVGKDFLCNLTEVHLNLLDPTDFEGLDRIFYLAGYAICPLLTHEFDIPKMKYSRDIDPIVAVSITGLFDFCVNAFGPEWLTWWSEGRPATKQGILFKKLEKSYLNVFRDSAAKGVEDYCSQNNMKVPNRYTAVQPAGTKSLLSGASCGWHPPKAATYIRRITFAKNDPVALACIDYGYTVVPAVRDKDENGNILNDPFDSRCTEWLVEIPVATPWAFKEGCADIDISKFSIAAQFDFYMQVQNEYSTHTTSATLEFREKEIPEFADLLYNNIQNNGGYMSAAMLARFDANETFPRLPFEPISKETYEELSQAVLDRRVSDDFHKLLLQYDTKVGVVEGPAGCDSDKCMLPEF